MDMIPQRFPSSNLSLELLAFLAWVIVILYGDMGGSSHTETCIVII